MMRLSRSGALRASLSQASRQATTTTSTTLIARAAASTTAQSGHAISNPTLANIEKRWEGMPLQEQAELWMALRDRMKENWTELTIQEKKAGESSPPPPRPDRSSKNSCTASTHPSRRNNRGQDGIRPCLSRWGRAQLAEPSPLAGVCRDGTCVILWIRSTDG